MKKIKLVIILITLFVCIDFQALASESVSYLNVKLLVDKDASVQTALSEFAEQYDYKIIWDTKDFILNISVNYESADPLNIIRTFIYDLRDNGKKITATVYKNKIIVIGNDSNDD